jgi:DNA-binding transcriptional regulator YiaG
MSLREGVPSLPFIPPGLISPKCRLLKTILADPVTIGEHVRRRRQELGNPQVEAAQNFGVTRGALARWETGTTNPGVSVMPAVIRFLGYDPQPEARSFAEFLNRTRRALGFNQHAFTAALGVPTGTLNAWTQDKHCPATPRQGTRSTRVIDSAQTLITRSAQTNLDDGGQNQRYREPENGRFKNPPGSLKRDGLQL